MTNLKQQSRNFNRPRTHSRWAPLLLVLTLVYVTTPLALRAEDEKIPSAEEILDKYVEVTGGKAAYEKLTSAIVHLTFEMPAQGLKADLQIYSAMPNKLYTVMESPALGKIEKGVSGDVAWEVTMMMGPQIKEGQERTDMLREAIFDKAWNWRKVYQKVECLGVETVNEKPCYKVVQSPPDGKPQTYYYDKESHLPVKLEAVHESPMGTIPIESYMSDYRKVGDFLSPHHVRVIVMGQERTITTQKIEYNAKIPEERFKLPPQIQQLLDMQKEKAAEPKPKEETPDKKVSPGVEKPSENK